MNINSFDRLYLHTLKDIYNAEKQLVKALPQMQKAASSEKLKKAFEEHLNETKHQVERIEEIFESLEFSPGGVTCEAMKGLIKEGKEIIEAGEIPSDVKDAGLIAAAQKVEHYEIASYGTAIHFARLLGNERAVELLEETLEEEKNADSLLNEVATRQVNEKAASRQSGEVGQQGGGGRPSASR